MLSTRDHKTKDGSRDALERERGALLVSATQKQYGIALHRMQPGNAPENAYSVAAHLGPKEAYTESPTGRSRDVQIIRTAQPD